GAPVDGPALDRRHERVRARGQHQGVVGHGPARSRPDLAGLAVERGDGVTGDELDRRMAEDVGIGQAQILGTAPGEVRREAHPVIGRPRLLTEGHDLPVLDGAVVDETFQQLVADHALADHDEGFPRSHDAPKVRGGRFSGVPRLYPACEQDTSALRLPYEARICSHNGNDAHTPLSPLGPTVRACPSAIRSPSSSPDAGAWSPAAA